MVSGRVLFVMLRGCHPWEEASTRCMHYKKFSLLREHNYAPWIGLDEDCRDLLGRMLINDPQGRLKTWKDLWRHPWIAQENPLFDERFLCADPMAMALALQAEREEPPANSQSKHSALTQPDVETASLAGITQRSRPLAFVGFSQPTAIPVPDEGNGPIDRDSGVLVSS